MRRVALVVISAALAAAAGCATSQRPVLYPNAHLKQVGDTAAQRDIDECLQFAERSGVSKTDNSKIAKRGAEGAAVGASAAAVGTLIRGGSVGQNAVTGAAVGGTAGAVHGAFHSDNPTYRNFVQRCLRERGYDVVGWQ
jgi:outer membrane lipoprotein SlyB